MPDIIKRITSNHSNIKIILENNHITSLATTLLEDDADIAFALATSFRNSTQLKVHRLTSIRHVILYSDCHRLSGRENVVPSDFKDDIFFIPAPDEATHIVELVKSYCEPYGFIPKIQGVKSFESLILNVTNGLGVAIADTWVSQTYSSLRCIELKSFHEISIAWRSNDDNPAIPIFLHELASIFYPDGASEFDSIAP